MKLKGSKTQGNLKAAFAGESQANRRYLYFAAKADVEGQNDVAVVFRSTAEGETGHAHGHLEYLEQCGDPATDFARRVTALQDVLGLHQDAYREGSIGLLAVIEAARANREVEGELARALADWQAAVADLEVDAGIEMSPRSEP